VCADIIPEFGQLVKLKMLFLNNNKLTGSVPHALTNMISLKSLWLHGNALENDHLGAGKALALQFDIKQNLQVLM
jgi:hypothetical protein